MVLVDLAQGNEDDKDDNGNNPQKYIHKIDLLISHFIIRELASAGKPQDVDVDLSKGYTKNRKIVHFNPNIGGTKMAGKLTDAEVEERFKKIKGCACNTNSEDILKPLSIETKREMVESYGKWQKNLQEGNSSDDTNSPEFQKWLNSYEEEG
ncbi:MAG: hypothetical protein PHD51_04405 [Patescibacteria group bacterium]|nr:hypothetical protein [Patescibacteria group bacterium]MDD5490775.1 hypothetical protein [Patescibacteria group bacterium]